MEKEIFSFIMKGTDKGLMTKRVLEENFSNSEEFNKSLTSLCDSGYVMAVNNSYVVTTSGYEWFSDKQLSK